MICKSRPLDASINQRVRFFKENIDEAFVIEGGRKSSKDGCDERRNYLTIRLSGRYV